MNEEQKAFINELLKKDGNLEHGKKSKVSKVSKSNVSKSKVNQYHMDVKTTYKYNGEPAVFNKLFDFINPSKKVQTANILAEILKNKNYSYFEQWDKYTFSKNRTSIYEKNYMMLL